MGKNQRPKLSKRFFKVPIAVMITAIVYEYLLKGRNPCFALIGAAYGCGRSFSEGFINGINRSIGTTIGGLLVIPTYYLYTMKPFGIPDWVWLVIGLCLVMVCNLLVGAETAIQPGSVVFFVVLFTVGQERVVTYTIARIIDTFVGVLFGLLVTLVGRSAGDKAKGLSIKNVWTEIRYSFKMYFYNNRVQIQKEQAAFQMEDFHVGEAPVDELKKKVEAQKR